MITRALFRLDLKAAASHYNGKGIENGIDVDSTLRALRGLKDNKPHHYQLKCSIESVLAASTWPAARVNEIHNSFPSVCPRCDICEETALHAFWQCQANANIDEESVSSSQCLCERATVDSLDIPCLWLRGILPDHLTNIDASHRPPDELHAHFINPESCVWSSGVYYGDASGGEHTSFPKLRRVGCGIASIDEHGALSFGAHCNLPGQVQTVSRGELFALVLLVRWMAPLSDVEFITDN